LTSFLPLDAFRASVLRRKRLNKSPGGHTEAKAAVPAENTSGDLPNALVRDI
jgi:hypothetical protein